jgi:hypothetical protein
MGCQDYRKIPRPLKVLLAPVFTGALAPENIAAKYQNLWKRKADRATIIAGIETI